jgi:magnesium-transporting ATPase (P-type)
MVQFDSTTIVTSVAHLIQLSVAPVFLLAAVGALLNVFTGRLSRIIDKVERLDQYENATQDKQPLKDMKQRREFLTMRMKNTNLAILFCTTTGLLISLVIVTMFLSALLEFKSAIFISILFILAMLCLSIALMLFLKEIFFTTTFIKSKKSYVP